MIRRSGKACGRSTGTGEWHGRFDKRPLGPAKHTLPVQRCLGLRLKIAIASGGVTELILTRVTRSAHLSGHWLNLSLVKERVQSVAMLGSMIDCARTRSSMYRAFYALIAHSVRKAW